MSRAFETARKDCAESFLQNGYVPYYRRSQLDAAARTVFADDGLSYHGRFHFYFSVLLFLKCAERTFHIWEGAAPDSDLGKYKVLIMHGLENKIGNPEIQHFYDKSEGDIQNLIYNWEEKDIDRAGAAGPSCIVALSMYLGHFIFDNNAKTEQEIDVYYWDSAFYSSVAVAGGADWQEKEKSIDVQARKNFWKWYVDDAIPQSYKDAVHFISG